MPAHQTALPNPQPRFARAVRSDPKTVPADKDYGLALNFNGKRPGLAAFSWVAIWRGHRGLESRAFPLDAHGFAEALQGAVTTILIETGTSVPQVDIEIAGYKEKRVNEYLRWLALEEVVEARTS